MSVSECNALTTSLLGADAPEAGACVVRRVEPLHQQILVNLLF